MVIPTWLAAVVVAFLLGQFGIAVMWAIRSDRDRALQASTLTRIVALLERHDPALLRAELDQHSRKLAELDGRYSAHHRLLRHLQRRLDRGGVEEVTGQGDDSDG